MLKTLGVTADLDTIQFRLLQGLPTAVVFLIPISLIKDMSGFRYVSVASIAALFYTGVVLLIELPEYARQNYPEGGPTAFKINWDFFGGAAMTFFAYTCQVNLLPIYSELVNPNEKRIKKVISRSIAIDVIFYLVIASAGFFSTYD